MLIEKLKTNHIDVDIKKNLELLLCAIEAIIPFSRSAGTVVDEFNAYDEWEDLIQQMFKSYILHAICDEFGDYWFREFHKLGCKIDRSLKQTFICAKKNDYTYYLFDILSPDGSQITSEWIRTSDKLLIRFGVDEVSNFEEVFIAKIH